MAKRTWGSRVNIMKSAALLFVSFSLLFLATATAAAKSSSIGIYAVIDEVKFDGDASSPNFVRISGVFIIPRPMSSGEYRGRHGIVDAVLDFGDVASKMNAEISSQDMAERTKA